MYPNFKNGNIFIFFVLLFTLMHMSCKKDNATKGINSSYDAYFIGSWQQTRRLDKDYKYSRSPVVTTTHHSQKTPLPKMIFNDQMDLITIYSDINYNYEKIFYSKWEIYNDYLVKDGLTDERFVKQNADSFIIVQNTINDISTQTEWKRIK